MKKRIIAIVLVVVAVVLLFTGCNMAVIDPGSYSFKKVHIDTFNGSRCLTVKKWHNNESGVEVDTEEVGPLFLSEGTYILVKDECPLCDLEVEF